jgi:hypothetical protein
MRETHFSRAPRWCVTASPRHVFARGEAGFRWSVKHGPFLPKSSVEEGFFVRLSPDFAVFDGGGEMRGADEALTKALASWTASLWEPKPQGRDCPLTVLYVDGHRKPVYARYRYSTSRRARKRGGVKPCLYQGKNRSRPIAEVGIARKPGRFLGHWLSGRGVVESLRCAQSACLAEHG